MTHEVCDVSFSDNSLRWHVIFYFYEFTFVFFHFNNSLGNKWFNFKFPFWSVVTTPLWGKCEDETHTLKSGNLEPSGTPATSELDSRGKNTSP
jgi:hypothetical protein